MRRLFKWSGRAIGFVGLVALIAFGFLGWQIDHYGTRDTPGQADAIVVLGAKVTASGQPGSDLTSRTYHAVDLYNVGWAPYVICTGGYANEPMSAAAAAARFAVSLGVPAEKVFQADGSMTTAEDARSTADVMRAHGWDSVILVSHPLHLYRARWSFQRAGLKVYSSPTTTDTGRIFPLLRLWYVTREAGALILTMLDDWGVLSGGFRTLQRWGYRTL